MPLRGMEGIEVGVLGIGTSSNECGFIWSQIPTFCVEIYQTFVGEKDVESDSKVGKVFNKPVTARPWRGHIVLW
jgi:hypothetical protein